MLRQQAACLRVICTIVSPLSDHLTMRKRPRLCKNACTGELNRVSALDETQAANRLKYVISVALSPLMPSWSWRMSSVTMYGHIPKEARLS